MEVRGGVRSLWIGVEVLGFGLHELVFVGGDVGEDVVVDVIDLHFVEDSNGVAVGSVRGGFEDNLEPGGVGAVFLVEEDFAEVGEIGDFSVGRVDALVVVDAVVLAGEEGDHGGRALVLTRSAVVG